MDAGPSFVFHPASLTIRVGDRIRVTNRDVGIPHNFEGAGQSSPDLSRGQTWTSLRFTRAGTFHFICTYHESRGMTGTLTVKA